MMRAAMIALCLVPLLGGCDKKKPDGLPPATDWQAPAAGSSVPMPSTGGGMPSTGGAMPGAADPHAGVPGAPPLNGGGGGGGGGGGVDVAQMGLPAPDPTRPMDPNKYLAGTIDAPEALRGKIPAGAAIFIRDRKSVV